MQLPEFVTPIFSHIKLSLFINMPVLLSVLVLFFIVYAVITSVIVYHWLAYGMKGHGILVAETLFLFVSAVLFVVSGLALVYF